MVIGVCGYSYTGSGAVTDLLREYENIEYCYDGEFLFPYYPDGLEDLEFHLTQKYTKYASGYVAIERYRRLIYIFTEYYSSFSKSQVSEIKKLTGEYLKQLIQVEWNGYTAADMILNYGTKNQFIIKQSLERLLSAVYRKFSLFDNTDLYPMHRVSLSIDPADFELITKKYINSLLRIIGYSGKKNILLDQPFSVNMPQNDFGYFDDPLAIIVNRDPRDLYLYTKYFLKNRARQIPVDDVEKFVEYYKRIHCLTTKADDVIYLRFEELIYEYDKIRSMLEERLNLGKHIDIKKYFDPSKSVNNTNMTKKMKYQEEDIKYIERELEEFLFPFDKYSYGNSGDMFA